MILRYIPIFVRLYKGRRGFWCLLAALVIPMILLTFLVYLFKESENFSEENLDYLIISVDRNEPKIMYITNAPNHNQYLLRPLHKSTKIRMRRNIMLLVNLSNIVPCWLTFTSVIYGVDC